MNKKVEAEVSLSKETEDTIKDIVKLVQASANQAQANAISATAQADANARAARTQGWVVGTLMICVTAISIFT